MRNPEGLGSWATPAPFRPPRETGVPRIAGDLRRFARYRELDDALGLTALAGGLLADSRTGRNGWHGIVSLLRQSVYGRLAGYEDVNDADRLGRDPAMRWIVGGKAVERGGASTSQMGRFETELGEQREPRAPCGPVGDVDRPGSRPRSAEARGARHGQLRQPDIQQESRPITALRLHLLSPAVRVQPVRRPGALRAAPRQRAQRARMA